MADQWSADMSSGAMIDEMTAVIDSLTMRNSELEKENKDLRAAVSERDVTTIVSFDSKGRANGVNVVRVSTGEILESTDATKVTSDTRHAAVTTPVQTSPQSPDPRTLPTLTQAPDPRTVPAPTVPSVCTVSHHTGSPYDCHLCEIANLRARIAAMQEMRKPAEPVDAIALARAEGDLAEERKTSASLRAKVQDWEEVHAATRNGYNAIMGQRNAQLQSLGEKFSVAERAFNDAKTRLFATEDLLKVAEKKLLEIEEKLVSGKAKLTAAEEKLANMEVLLEDTESCLAIAVDESSNLRVKLDQARAYDAALETRVHGALDDATTVENLREQVQIQSEQLSDREGTIATLSNKVEMLWEQIPAPVFCRECGEHTQRHDNHCVQCIIRDRDEIAAGYQEIIRKLTEELVAARVDKK